MALVAGGINRMPCAGRLFYRQVDGDTIRMTWGGKEVKLRHHGIDTPEVGQLFGSRAKQFTSSLAFGKCVRAEVVDTDRYGRKSFIERGRVSNRCPK